MGRPVVRCEVVAGRGVVTRVGVRKLLRMPVGMSALRGCESIIFSLTECVFSVTECVCDYIPVRMFTVAVFSTDGALLTITGSVATGTEGVMMTAVAGASANIVHVVYIYLVKQHNIYYTVKVSNIYMT